MKKLFKDNSTAFTIINALVAAKVMNEVMTPKLIDKAVDDVMPEILRELAKQGEYFTQEETLILKEMLREYTVLYLKTGADPDIEDVMRVIERRGAVKMQPINLRETAHAIATDMQCLSQYPERTAEEVTELGKIIPFRVIKDPTQFVQWARAKRVALRDAYALLTWAGQIKDFISGIVPDGDVTYDEVQKAFDLAQTQSIMLHRVNYLLHEQMLTVYELLEREKKLRFLPKKHYRAAEDCWTRYERPRRRAIDLTAWSTLDDHLRIAANVLQPRLQRVYEAARDRMIYLGVKDVELRSRIVVALTVGKVQHLSFKHFFDDFRRDLHCDMRRLFAQDDLLPMTIAFADMVRSLGIKTVTDKYGLPSLADFDIDSSVRTGWAWQSFMRELRDVDLMDDTARQAINLNPKVQQDYIAVLKQAEEERRLQEQEEMAAQLAEKYKVTKL